MMTFGIKRRPVRLSIGPHLLVLLGLWILGPIGFARADHTTADAVRESLDRLEKWLDRQQYGDAWRNYLQSELLQTRLKTGSVDAATVKQVLSAYESGAKGLELARFASVRLALTAWLRELEEVPRDQIPGMVRAAKGQFQAPTKEALQAKRRRVRQTADALDRYLQRGGRSYAAAWKRYLNWNELTSELAKGKPDLQKLNTVLQPLYGYQEGLELPVFQNLRMSLHEYMNASLVYRTPQIAAEFDKKLDELATQLEAYASDPSNAHAVAIAQNIGWLNKAEQVPELQRVVRKLYAQPNFFGSVSRRFAAKGVDDAVDQTVEVSDRIMGTSMRGTAHTVGRLKLHLVPNPRQAEFEVQLSGTAHSDNVGQNRGVRIYSTGTTSLEGRKTILFDPKGIRALPASAECDTESSINDIQHHLRIIEKIAWKQAGKQQSQAESIASRHAEQRVAKQMNDQTAKLLREPRRGYMKHFRNPLLRRGEFPQSMQVATSSDGVRLYIMQANMSQLGAPAAPPELSGDFDLAVRVHESFVGNLAEGLMAGYTLTDERLVKLLVEAKREVPDELKISRDKDPWSITFADSQPIHVDFADQKVRIVIHGKRFTRGMQKVNAEMDIFATYALTRTPQGAKLTREGEVEAEYTKKGYENVAEIAVKTLMRQKFSALFKEEFVGDGLKLKGRWGENGPMRLGQLDSNDGWLVAGWSLPAATKTARVP